MTLLHVGGASTASIVVSIFVIFFMIFAVSFAFGAIPEGKTRLSRESIAAWFRASMPRLVVAGVFSAAIGAGALFLGENPSGTGAATARCETGVPPSTGKALTEARLVGAIDGMQQIAEAAGQGDISYVQTLFFTMDAHGFTHDVDLPLRQQDSGLARDLCLSVVVLETQLASTLDAAVIAREASSVAEYLTEARQVLVFAPADATASTVGGLCSSPVGAATDQSLTTARLESAIAVLRWMSEEAEVGKDLGLVNASFIGDAHNVTHDIDAPLRLADEQLGIDLCESVLALEMSFGAEPDRETIVAEAAASADLIEQAGRELEILQ